jgi:hypothetical protein
MTIDIRSMGYARVASTDLDQWRHFAGKVLGLGEGRGPDPENLYYRIDEVSARLVVFPSDKDELSCVGWELADHPALQAAREHLQKAGVEFEEGTAEELAERRVQELVRFHDPALIDALTPLFPALRPAYHPWDKLPWVARPGGDLAELLGLQQELPESRPALQLADDRIACIRKQTSAASQAFLSFKDAAFETVCPERPLNVLMLRDSFTVHLQPYLSQQFGRMFYLWRTFADHPLFFRYVKNEKPDLVIEQLTERSLFPSDQNR